MHDDSMNKLNTKLIDSQLVVFVTPLYYFGMSAQMKTVIDRFYANNSKLMGSHKKAILLVLEVFNIYTIILTVITS